MRSRQCWPSCWSLLAYRASEYPVCCFDAKAAMRSTAQWTITRDEVSKALKGAAMRMGESTDDLASHSLRIGGATALAAAGAPDSFICYWGFWKSPAYRGYLRHVKEDPTCTERKGNRSPSGQGRGGIRRAVRKKRARLSTCPCSCLTAPSLIDTFPHPSACFFLLA